MRYVLACLSNNSEKLKKLDFESIEDLKTNTNLKNLPLIPSDKKARENLIKILGSAFRLDSAPQEKTLDFIKKQFEIELSYIQFKKKLKEEDATFLAYYKEELASRKNAREPEKAKSENAPKADESRKDTSIVKPRGLRGWFSANTVRLIISIAILITVAAIFTIQAKEDPLKDVLKKKQVETVLELYHDILYDSVEIKFVLVDRYATTTLWPKEPGDSFYESGTSNISLLHMENAIRDDVKTGRYIAGKYLRPKILLVKPSSLQIIDSFTQNREKGEMYLPYDRTLPYSIPFGELFFASEKIINNTIIKYGNSPLLPDSIKYWLLKYDLHRNEYGSLNTAIQNRESEITVIGSIGSIEGNFENGTLLYEWYDLNPPERRITLTELFYMNKMLEQSIITYLNKNDVYP